MSPSNDIVEAVVRHLMRNGAKTRVRRFIARTFEEISKRDPTVNPEKVLTDAVRQAMPFVETFRREIAGATYRVPRPVRESERLMRGIQRILAQARRQTGRLSARGLANTLLMISSIERDPDPPTKGAMRLSARHSYGAG